MRSEDPKYQYIESLFQTENEIKLKSRQLADQFHRGMISLSPVEGRILQLLTHLMRGEKFVEIGTLTGLSAQYILDGLPNGSTLWTLEKSIEQAMGTQKIFSELSKNKTVNLVVGDAQATLKELETHGPFDGVFIDGNKSAYLEYLNWSEKNIRIGGLIIADNVFLRGAVWGEPSDKFSSKQIQVMKEFNQRLTDPSKYLSCFIPSNEGMLVAIKKG